MVGSWATRRAPAASGRSLTSQRNVTIPLSFYPDLAIHEVLFFPNRNELFEAIDSFQRGVERGAAMRRRDDHGDARLADQHAAQPVHHRDVGHLMGRRNLAADP